MKSSPRRQHGFTMVEILVALAILGVMAAIVIPSVSGFLGRGKDRAYNADLAAIQAASDAYYSDPANVRYQGKRQYPIFGRKATSNLKGTDCADNLKPSAGQNPDQGAKGGTPVWADDNGNGKRDDGELWNKATLVSGLTTYCFSTGNYIIDMQELVDKEFLQSIPDSASADNKPDLTGSYTWFVNPNGRVDSLFFFFPTPDSTGHQKGVFP